jgi:hypothetical protein
VAYEKEKPPPYRRPYAPLPAALEDESRRAVLAAIAKLRMVRTFIAYEFAPEVDYGTIPGTPKASLWAPGAQKILLLFDAAAHSEVEVKELPGGHAEFTVTTRAVSNRDGTVLARAVAACTTRENKYLYRASGRSCPECGSGALMKSKRDPGWWCNTYREGCGKNFKEDDPRIANQDTAKAETDNPNELRATCLAMAKKRSLVACATVLGCLSEACSDRVVNDDMFDLSDAREPQAAAEPARHEPTPSSNGEGEDEPLDDYEAIAAWWPSMVDRLRKAWATATKNKPELGRLARELPKPPIALLALAYQSAASAGWPVGDLADQPDDADFLAALAPAYRAEPGRVEGIVLDAYKAAAGQVRSVAEQAQARADAAGQ